MVGWIYRIYDTRNGMSYIGQTINIKNRILQHKNSINNKRCTSKVYKYFRDVPTEYIKFEILCECDSADLDRLEAYYISMYDAYKNGLNTATVSFTYRNPLIDEQHNKIHQAWLSGKTYTDIACEFGISVTQVSKIINFLRKDGDKPARNKVKHTNKAKPVICYDIRYNPLFVFRTIQDAYKYLTTKRSATISKYSVYVHIEQSALKGNVAYGFRWQYVYDLYYDGKVFNTRWDIEAYKNGKLAVKNKYGLYECDNEYTQGIRKIEQKPTCEVRLCKVCGTELSRKTTGDLCSKCMDHNGYKDRQVPTNTKITYPFIKEELEQLYPKYTALSIANHCGVSYTTVNRWLKRFGIKE